MNRLRLLTALLASICATAAFAQNHGPVEVAGAVQQDVLGSLRDVKPNPADFRKMKARVEHDLPLPHVPDNQSDGALQGAPGFQAFAPISSGATSQIVFRTTLGASRQGANRAKPHGS